MIRKVLWIATGYLGLVGGIVFTTAATDLDNWRVISGFYWTGLVFLAIAGFTFCGLIATIKEKK